MLNVITAVLTWLLNKVFMVYVPGIVVCARACKRDSLWVIGRCHENMAAYTLKWLSGYSLAVILSACKTTEQNR